MTTKNPRVNVVLEKPLYKSLKALAHAEDVSVSLMARDLIREAMAEYEDTHWAKVSAEREKTFSPQKALSHKKVWQK